MASHAANRRFQAVWAAWESFKAANPDQGPEQFLTHLYRNRPFTPVPWEWAVEIVAAALATPRGDDMPVVRNPRYSGRITTPVQVPEHDAFWDLLFTRTPVLGVVTTNYDLLAERGLRHRPLKRRPRPGFYYGGIARPQLLKGLAQPWTVLKPDRVVTLTGAVPLFKLHGSLNWANEAGQLMMYQDMRPAFRFGGDAAILPPLTNKEAPAWLRAVWEQAHGVLASCPRWVVCGYSLPHYDAAVREFFARTARNGLLREVFLLDPQASALHAAWSSMALHAEIICLQGLPGGITELRVRLQ